MESKKKTRVTPTEDSDSREDEQSWPDPETDDEPPSPGTDGHPRRRKTPQPSRGGSPSEHARGGSSSERTRGGSPSGHARGGSSGTRHLVLLNAEAPFAGATRSLYLGNLPAEATIRDICDTLRGDRGIEAVRLLPAKSCAFVDFLSRHGAERFVARCRRQRRVQVARMDVRLGWAKETVMQPSVAKALENGATRNIYISNLFSSDSTGDDPFMRKFGEFYADLHGEGAVFDMRDVAVTRELSNLDHPLVSFVFGMFDAVGPVDMVKLVPARHIAFVHMATVADAMRAVAELSTRPEFRGKRLAFGRDRCGERLEDANVGANASADVGPQEPSLHSSSVSQTDVPPSRTVFLGGVPSTVTIEDVCDLVHTGQLQSVRINTEKRCAFITFIRSDAADRFLSLCMQFGVVLRGTALRVAWANEHGERGERNERDGRTQSTDGRTHQTRSPALPAAISSALQRGCTRNLYLGNVDFALLSEPHLRGEMARFGPLDRIQLLRDRGIAFIHFANLLDAARAFEKLRDDLGFRACRLGFGRDRCEPPPVNTADSSRFVPPPRVGPFYSPSPVAFSAHYNQFPMPIPIQIQMQMQLQMQMQMAAAAPSGVIYPPAPPSPFGQHSHAALTEIATTTDPDDSPHANTNPATEETERVSVRHDEHVKDS